jgi:hypothetical protein
MEAISSNSARRGKGVSKGNLSNIMSVQQCQTNWEYSEVLVFIKCKEVKYIT